VKAGFWQADRFFSMARTAGRRLSRGGARSTTSEALPGLPQRTVIGPYHLEKELGKGAMGIVYLGCNRQKGQVAAIKTLDLVREFDAAELAAAKRRFFHEAAMVERLTHPNIVALYEAGEEQDLAWLAMEFMAGRDLLPWCRAGTRLPLPTVLSIGARVAAALDYAHGRGIVHRDIKPANILYAAASDQVKVTDFGIAAIADTSRVGMVLGTPSYMSPEQLAGEEIDGRSDIYSLGVTLYQLCSGQLPFTGESLAELMYKIARETPPDISRIEPTLPPDVAGVIARAMTGVAERRYQRAADLAADLRGCLASVGGEGR
jgi:serine/threonine-protein kinase